MDTSIFNEELLQRSAATVLFKYRAIWGIAKSLTAHGALTNHSRGNACMTIVQSNKLKTLFKPLLKTIDIAVRRRNTHGNGVTLLSVRLQTLIHNTAAGHGKCTAHTNKDSIVQLQDIFFNTLTGSTMYTFFRKAAAVSLLVEAIFFIPSGDCTLMILKTTHMKEKLLECKHIVRQIQITVKWIYLKPNQYSSYWPHIILNTTPVPYFSLRYSVFTTMTGQKSKQHRLTGGAYI